MQFRPCIHYYRKGNRVLLTQEFLRKIEKIKLTGTKIPEFFKMKVELPNEEEEYDYEDGEETPGDRTEYRIWTKIFNFSFANKKRPRDSEKYRSVEDMIKEYLTKQLNRTWISYSLDMYDVFEDHEHFGGVPDGEERNERGEPISILEIKTITDIRNEKHRERFMEIPMVYQMQLALYLYLNNLDTGFICICYMNSDNWTEPETISLNSPLYLYEHNREVVNVKLESYVGNLGEFDYDYQILEAYCNNFLEDNELILFKVKINMEKYGKILDRLRVWFEDHRIVSPRMTDSELSKFLTRNKGA